MDDRPKLTNSRVEAFVKSARQVRYDRLTPRQKELVDALMDGTATRPWMQNLGKIMGCSLGTIRSYLQLIYMKYGIEQRTRSPFTPMVRLVYLRSKELGLL